MSKKLMPKSIIMYVVAVVLIIGLVVANVYANAYAQIISVYLGQSTEKVVSTDDVTDTNYFKSDFDSKEALLDYQNDLVKRIEQEGIVLVKNDNETLPLDPNSQISVFGKGSVDFIYGGGGSGAIDVSLVDTLFDSLSASGFDINPSLWDFYKEGPGKNYVSTVPDIQGQGNFSVAEVPASDYTDDVISSFDDYADAAVVVISRSGGESADIPSSPLESGKLYLELSDEERDMLQMAKDHFDKVVVVLNTTNTVELGFLDDYDIDACIWVGAVGQAGIDAIGEVLNGDVNPSGRFVDTFAYDVLSAPAVMNFGNYDVTNSEVTLANKYMNYAENIYVGYRYYETRYEDVILGNESPEAYNYSETVQYPFGYGLSYTNFDWSDYQVTESDGQFEIQVTVSNNGQVAGKDVVQIYMQSPYTDYDQENGIEKASVELVGFEKTDLIEAGQSQTVTVTVPKEALKVYDAYGHQTYIVDAGDYYFTAGKNAHDALNNILASKGNTRDQGMTQDGQADLAYVYQQAEMDTTTYAVSQVTQNPIENEFDIADIKTYDDQFEYLSRSDWEGTWPVTYKDGAYGAPESLLKELPISYEENPEAQMPTQGVTDESIGKIPAIAMKDLDYNDDIWNTFLDQLTIDEMTELVRMGGYATVSIPSVSLPATLDKDGPAGISGTLTGGNIEAMSYPCEMVLAATWNRDLVEEMGQSVGEDSLANGVTGWYAPGINIHRLPFGGRNFEYYSEDSFLSGEISAAEIRGAVSKGVIVYMKHFALNDQETNRYGGLMFANEQSIRQIYLKAFETAVREGDVNGVMVSMNRVGPVWTGGHKGLMTDTLRNEWGFNGVAITDQASYSYFVYEDIIEGQVAGTNLWLNTDASLWEIPEAAQTPTVVTAVRDSAHSIIYSIVNSNAMNGIAADTQVVSVTPTWRYWLLALNIILILGILVLIYTASKSWIKESKKNKAQ